MNIKEAISEVKKELRECGPDNLRDAVLYKMNKTDQETDYEALTRWIEKKKKTI